MKSSKATAIVAAICGAMVLSACGGTPADAVNGFYGELNKGNVSAAKEYLGKRAFGISKDSPSMGAVLMDTVREYTGNGGLIMPTTSAEKCEVKGEVASCRYQLRFEKFKDNSAPTVDKIHVLQKADGKWLIVEDQNLPQGAVKGN